MIAFEAHERARHRFIVLANRTSCSQSAVPRTTGSNDSKKRVRDFSKLVGRNIQNTNWLTLLGFANLALGDFSTAERNFDDAIRQSRSYRPAYVGRARVYDALGKKNLAAADR